MSAVNLACAPLAAGLALAAGAVLAAGPVDPIEVQGHRGARAARPENTLPAFEYALKVGVDTLELDLAVTKDDVLVVSHDPFVNPTLCRGKLVPIRTLTAAQVRKIDCGSKRNPRFKSQVLVPKTPMPTLDEVLRLAKPTRVDLNIETKLFPAHPELTPTPQRFAELIVAQVRAHGMQTRVIVQSFDHRSLRAVKQLEPKIRIALLLAESLPDHVALAKSLGAEIISPHREWITAQDVEALHAIGVRVVPWTVNDLAEVDRLLALGVDGLITDDPRRVIEHLRRIGRR